MKAESRIAPTAVTIEPLGNQADVLLAENIKLVDRDGEGFYQFDGYRITVTNRPGLKELVEANFADWLKMAKDQENAPKEQTIPERIGAVETTTGEIVTVLADIMEVTL